MNLTVFILLLSSEQQSNQSINQLSCERRLIFVDLLHRERRLRLPEAAEEVRVFDDGGLHVLLQGQQCSLQHKHIAAVSHVALMLNAAVAAALLITSLHRLSRSAPE